MSKNLYQRIHAAMQECSYVQKSITVSGYGAGYKAVSHDAVAQKVRAALLAHGVIAPTTVLDCARESVTVAGKNGDRIVNRTTVRVRTDLINVDAPDERLSVESIGTGEDSGDKADGKAVSYATKYALLKALLLETGDDADKDASMERVSPSQWKAMALDAYKQLAAQDKAAADAIAAQMKRQDITHEQGYHAMRTALGILDAMEGGEK